MSELQPHVAEALKAAYPSCRAIVPHVSAFHVTTPDPSLVEQLEHAAEEMGIPATAIDWTTFLPQIITAISTGNWLGLIGPISTLVADYGPQVWQMIQAIITLFTHKMPVPTPAPSTGPTITGH